MRIPPAIPGRTLFLRIFEEMESSSFQTGSYEISDDADVFRETVAAFVCVLRDYYAQDVKVAGILKKRIEAVGPGYRGELLDLFYRCVFEGLDLAPEGEAISRPG
jgi:hypothetical protein